MITQSSRPMRGVCCFHSETGTEGGFWAFQDSTHISEGEWLYEGLHILKDNDRLTIFDPADHNKVVWSGSICLIHYPVFKEDVWGTGFMLIKKTWKGKLGPNIFSRIIRQNLLPMISSRLRFVAGEVNFVEIWISRVKIACFTRLFNKKTPLCVFITTLLFF